MSRAWPAGRAPRTGPLTGERPRKGVTPRSLVALHDAGYRAVLDRLGAGWVLDVGCGEGFETVRLAGGGRFVLGVDRDRAAAGTAHETGSGAVVVARMDALALGLRAGAFDAAVSSHLIEHFVRPEDHVVELARVLAPGGTAYFLTPNAPADFENPFHLRLFRVDELAELLARYFAEVWVAGIDAPAPVKADFAARRAKAERVLRLDVFDLRHRMPRRWYLAIYTALLPLAYRFLARDAGAEGTGSAPGADGEWSVIESVDDTTLVLFAVCRGPKRPSNANAPSPH